MTWLKRSCAASYDREGQQTALLTGPALPRLAGDQPWNTHTDTDFLFETNKSSVCCSSVSCRGVYLLLFGEVPLIRMCCFHTGIARQALSDVGQKDVGQQRDWTT